MYYHILINFCYLKTDEEATDEEAMDEEATDEEATDEEAMDEEATDGEVMDEEETDEEAKDEEVMDEEETDEKATDEEEISGRPYSKSTCGANNMLIWFEENSTGTFWQFAQFSLSEWTQQILVPDILSVCC